MYATLIVSVAFLLAWTRTSAVFKCSESKFVIAADDFKKDTKIINRMLFEGFTVILKKGVYMLKDHIKFTNDSCLFGAGSGEDGTKLMVANSDYQAQYDGVIRIVNVKNARMKSFSVNTTACNSNKYCKYNVKIQESDDLIVQDVSFVGGNTDSVMAQNSSKIELDRVTIHKAGRHCFHAQDTNGIFISDTHVSSCVYHGFSLLSGSTAALVESSAKQVGKKLPSKSDPNEKRPIHGCGAYFDHVSTRKTGSLKPEFAVEIDNFKVEDAYFAGIWAVGTSVKAIRTSVTVTNQESTMPTACYRTDKSTMIELVHASCPEPLKCLRVDAKDGKKTSHKIYSEFCGKEE